MMNKSYLAILATFRFKNNQIYQSDEMFIKKVIRNIFISLFLFIAAFPTIADDYQKVSLQEGGVTFKVPDSVVLKNELPDLDKREEVNSYNIGKLVLDWKYWSEDQMRNIPYIVYADPLRSLLKNSASISNDELLSLFKESDDFTIAAPNPMMNESMSYKRININEQDIGEWFFSTAGDVASHKFTYNAYIIINDGFLHLWLRTFIPDEISLATILPKYYKKNGDYTFWNAPASSFRPLFYEDLESGNTEGFPNILLKLRDAWSVLIESMDLAE